MQNKPKEIVEIEKQLGITLQELEIGDIIDSENRNTYQVSTDGEVIGLNLRDIRITDISFLQEIKQLTTLILRNNQITDITVLQELQQLTTLILWKNQFTDFTVIQELRQLTALFLIDNQISDISFLQNLKGLSTLALSKNKITNFTVLRDLKQLTILDIGLNKISDISFLQDFNQLTTLNLWNNQIKDISFLQDLKQLTSLNLMHNQISDITVLKDLKALTILNLSENQITDFTVLKDLEQLNALYLSENSITDISFLKDLKQLIKLDLSINEITDISFLQNIKGLTTLNLSSNKIKDIYFLQDLKQLTTLDLSANQITDISFLKDLASLTSLRLSNNHISDISFLQEIKELTTLSLSLNPISDYSFLINLQSLIVLKLYDNHITDISFLQDLKQLTSLDLSKNQITDISFLQDIKGLTTLNLSSNKISDISFLQDLKQLTTLDLSSNQITDITVLQDLTGLNSLYLSNNPIEGTTISNFNDIQAVKGYLESIRNEELVENYDVKINILGAGRIGKSQLFNWLTNKEFIENQQETHGTGVDIYKIDNYKASLWDFGGQSYQHGTHSLFLRPKDLYIVLHHSEKIEFPYAYWLGAARTFAPDNKEDKYVTPLFLVQSVWSCDKNEVVYPNSHTITNYQVNPKHILAIDVKLRNSTSDWDTENAHFIKLLNNEIKNYAQSFGKVPTKFVQIKENIIDTPITDIFIKKEEFKINYANDLSDSQFAYLLQYLEFTGTIIHFREKGLLEEYVFTNPKDLSDWIYQTILKEDFTITNSGILDFNKLKSDFTEEVAWVFKELMLDFNLLFEEIGNENNLVIPQFLPEHNISFKKVILELIPFTFSIKFQDFIYEGRIFNFISEYGEFAEDNSSYWKYGILFKKDEIQSIVYYNSIERIIYVHLENKKGFEILAREILDYFILKQDKKDFSSKRISKFLRENNISLDNFNKIYYEKYGETIGNINGKIPIEHEDYLLNLFENKKYYKKEDKVFKLNKDLKKSYDVLSLALKSIMFNNRKIRELNKNEIIFGSQISTNNKNYFDIIKTIENTGNNPLKVGYCIEDKKHIALDLLTLNLLGMNDTKLKKIFISYSRQNLQYKDALKSHLSLLDRYGLVKAWSCDEMKAGTWHDQIQKELEEADIIIYMVSHEFMDSEYIMEDEVKKGIKLVEEDKSKKLICVLTGVCQWKNWSSFEKLLKENGGENSNFSSMDLSQFQFLPYHQYKNEQGIAIREEIVALEQWGRYPYDVINVAYNQIVNRVLAEIKQ